MTSLSDKQIKDRIVGIIHKYVPNSRVDFISEPYYGDTIFVDDAMQLIREFNVVYSCRVFEKIERGRARTFTSVMSPSRGGTWISHYPTVELTLREDELDRFEEMLRACYEANSE